MNCFKNKARLFPPIVGLIICLLITSAPVVSLSEPRTQEYEIKAAFLFNFARLTKWPANSFSSPDKEFVVCILGDDPFGRSLDALMGQTIDGHTVSISRTRDIRESSDCNLLFVSSSERNRLPEIIAHVGNMPVLTVSDIRGFESEGGIIGFYLKDGHVRFRINIDTARKSKLKMSSHLLEVAETVSEGRTQ